MATAIQTEIGNIEKRIPATNGKGDWLYVQGQRYYIAKENPDYSKCNAADLAKIEFELTGKDGSLKLIHHLSPLTESDVDEQRKRQKEEGGVVEPTICGKIGEIIESEKPQTAVVVPLQDIDQIKSSWGRFQAIKKEVVDAGDIQEVERNGEKKAYIKKSGWRKIQVAYGLRVEILDKERMLIDYGEVKGVMWNVTARATAPSGACATAIGSCNSMERGGKGVSAFAHGESDMLMTAQTRATSRAISDVVGSGEVSAEEMTAN